MKVLCLLLILNTTLAHAGFGKAYMRKSRLCHQWSCLNTNLGFPDALPSQEEFTRVLKALLPSGPWQDIVDKVTETCYHERSRRYTNTCPGQAVIHCAVDQLNNNCPDESVTKKDACAPINSLAGFGNMFTQSRYENIENNLSFEKRPAWFLRNYFNTKCCDIPVLFNSTLLNECGFTSMMSYYIHKPNYETRYVLPNQRRDNVNNVEQTTNAAGLIIRSFDDLHEESNDKVDPFECCDMSHFIPAEVRQECSFKLHWEGQNRLVIDKGPENITTTEMPTTTSERPLLHRDISIIPQSCDKTTCVFNKIPDILTETASVNLTIFMKLLDNFTSDNPMWTSAKARVVTTCLTKTQRYEAECEINKVLACTFDVLTENCPSGKRNDSCKHSKQDKICQISSSKYRPKYRRDTCVLPEIVNKMYLDECGLDSLTQAEQVNQYSTHINRKRFDYHHRCQDLTPSMSCVLSKLGVMNKYGFLDYFKMKDKIRSLPTDESSSDLNVAYLNAFTNWRLYNEHCNSPRKFLNLIDSMIMTCPYSKRKPTSQCTKLFQNITNSINEHTSKEHLENIIKHYQHVFLPTEMNQNPIYPKFTKRIVKKPLFNYGLLNSKYAPEVEIIDVQPKVEIKPQTIQQPLVLLPVYMRVPNSNVLVSSHNDALLRKPFWLHNAIAQTHSQSTFSPISTKVSTAGPISTTQESTPAPISPITEISFDLVRP